VSAGIIITIASIAAWLSIVGLYAVTVHAVSQRRRELGVRVALGATARDVRWLVIRRATWQITIGLVVGTLATYGWDRLFGLDRWSHPLTVAAMAGGLGLVALAACLVPASRAAPRPRRCVAHRLMHHFPRAGV
jgi:putative ABC transport system permease protein